VENVNSHFLFFSHVSETFNVFPQLPFFHVDNFSPTVLLEMMDKFSLY
jgi:hypothetical protein